MEEVGVGKRRNAFRVGAHRVDPMANEIDGVHVDSKAMDVLVCLAAVAPGVVANATLFEQVWPRVVVGDNALHQAILHLRKAFGDDARTPRYIENIPRRGYRLIAGVQWPDAALSLPDSNETRDPPPARSEARRVLLAWMSIVMLVAALLGLGGHWNLREAQAPAESGALKRSIVVRPFTSSDGDAALDEFARGLVSDVLAQLAETPQLMVFRGSDATRDTQAGYALQGGVRAAGEELRVTVQLTQTSDGAQVWSQNYDRPRDRLLRDASDLVTAIAYAARTRAISDASDSPRSHYGLNDPTANELYMHGRWEYNRLFEGRGGNWDLVRSLYGKAIAVDPTFYRAHVVLAESYTYTAGWHEPLDEAQQRAYRAFGRAFALLPHGTGAWGLAHYGKTLLVLDMDYEAAVVELRAGARMEPLEPFFPMFLAQAHAAAGQSEDAANALNLLRSTLAYSADRPGPLYAMKVYFGWMQFVLGQYANAISEWNEALAVTENPRVRAFLMRQMAWAEARLQHREAAIEFVDRAWKLTGEEEPHAYIASFALTGREARAHELLSGWSVDDFSRRKPLFARSEFVGRHDELSRPRRHRQHDQVAEVSNRGARSNDRLVAAARNALGSAARRPALH